MKRILIAAALAIVATASIAADEPTILPGKVAVKGPGENFYRAVERPELRSSSLVLSAVRSKSAGSDSNVEAIYVRHALGVAGLSPEHQLSRTDFLWSYTMGANTLTVAVLDQPFSKDAPAVNHAWDLANAYDIRNNDNDPWLTPADVDPANGAPKIHGTSVASVLQSISCKGQTRSTNPMGCYGAEYSQGVAPQAKVMPINICCAVVDGVEIRDAADDVTIANAILYAARLSNSSGKLPSKKADAIVLSYDIFNSAGTASAIIGDAISQAVDAGVLFVTGSGNARAAGKQVNESAYTSKAGVIVVSAANLFANPITRADGRVIGYGPGQIASYSTPGSAVDVAAEGQMSVSYPTFDTGRIAHTIAGVNGTSYAAPYVAGIYILAKSVYPGLTPAKFDSWLKSDAITFANSHLGGAGEPRDNDFGYGVVDAQRVLTQALAASSQPNDVRPDFDVTISLPRPVKTSADGSGFVVAVTFKNPYGSAAPMSQYKVAASWSPALRFGGVDPIGGGCEGDGGELNPDQPAGSFLKTQQMFYYGGAQTCTLHYLFGAPSAPTTFHFQIDAAGNDASSIREPVKLDVEITAPTPNVSGVSISGPDTVVAGAAFALTWAANDATACAASGAWSGDLSQTGSRTLSAPTSPGTYTYGITCTNGNPSQGTASKTVTVAAKPSDGGEGGGGGGGALDLFALIPLLLLAGLRHSTRAP